MKTSIRTRVVLTATLATLAVSILAGGICIEIACETIEKRLTVDMTRNASRMISNLRVTPNDGVMVHLSEIFGAEAVAISMPDKRLYGSSLSKGLARECETILTNSPDIKSLTLDKKRYITGVYDIPYQTFIPGKIGNIKLYMLLPEEQIQAARDEATDRIMMAALPTVLTAILIAALLSLTVTLPITRLSKQAETTSREISDSPDYDSPAFFTGRGPVEVQTLSKSLDHLVSSLKIANTKLMKTRRMADVGRLAASAAHELKNPLSGIKMNARVLLDELNDNDENRELVEVIFGEIERMDIYLRELTYLAKDASAGESHLFKPDKQEQIAPKQIMEDAFRILQRRFTHSDITVQKEYSETTPDISVDKTQIRQVIINLMINAMESNNAGKHITLSTNKTDQGHAIISISDNGGGVSNSDTRNIFAPFVTSQAEGAGLGLHICKKIIEAHRGTIDYKNTATGAVFFFTLPNTEETQ